MKPSLCIVVTVPMSLGTLLAGQARYLSQRFDVSLVCGEGDAAMIERVADQEGMVPHIIPLTRAITPARDVRAVVALVRHLREIRADIVQTYTPKAGLVGMAAARLARVPVRVHGVVGMPLMEARGGRAALLHVSERATYANATHLTCNSFGLRDWMREHLTSRPVTVVGQGSINGVDVERFSNTWDDEARWELRSELGIKPDDFVFLFVGRIVRDKGIEELVTSFVELTEDHPDARLLLVGDYEPGLDPVSGPVDTAIRTHPKVVKTGFVRDVRPYLALSDAFVLPSYREGLPNSLIEAGSMGCPSIATDINGCNEVIVPEENGVLVPPKDAGALQREMRRMIDDRELTSELAARSRASVVERYGQEYFWPRLETTYEAFLAEARQAT